MGGGLMQIVANGAADIYLTGSPETSFFKAVYKRHTHFALETIPVTFNGDGASGVLTCNLSRNGDLIGRTYLEVHLPTVRGRNVRWVSNVGHAIIKSVSLTIGGQMIDHHSGEWMHIWDELTVTDREGRNRMMCAESDVAADVIADQILYVPLQFHFCKHLGCELPMISLRFHEIKINVDLHAVEDLLEYDELHDVEQCERPRLLVEYIYLDTDERRNFAQTTHEILITQLQTNTFLGQSGTASLKLDLGLPCKELVFVCRAEGAAPHDFTCKGRNPVRSALLKLNGLDRMCRMPGKYFNVLQPRQHHSRVPCAGVNVYSFALRPESFEPTGSCNMSRMDSMSLELDLEDGVYSVSVYATNINVLRIMSGMAHCAFRKH